MTPTDELREAARLMRNDAETAAVLREGDPYYVAQVLPDGSVLTEQPTFERRWHPAVALAVADLLDREADTAARFHDGRVSKYDLAVARAYLGQSMCHSGHPFVPGIAEDAPDTPDDRWCNTCGEARRAQPVMPARNEPRTGCWR